MQGFLAHAYPWVKSVHVMAIIAWMASMVWVARGWALYLVGVAVVWVPVQFAPSQPMPAAEAGLSIAALGMDLPPKEQATPAAFAAFHKSEVEKWYPIVQAAGVKPRG